MKFFSKNIMYRYLAFLNKNHRQLCCIINESKSGAKRLIICALCSKLYIPSTLNIDFVLWYTQLIVCAENVKSWFKSWVFPFTFQAYILHHLLNCMCASLFKFHT